MEIFVIIVFSLWVLATLILKSPIVVTIPRFWYSGITLGWLIVLRREDYSDKLVAHEFIHFKQQKETLIIFGYILYLLEFIIKSIYYGSFRKGYFAISFEREAILMSGTPEYVFNRRPFMFRHFMFMDSIVVVNRNFTRADFESKVFSIKRAGVFKFDGEFATISNLISKFTLAGKKFRVKIVRPGTSLYTIYGDNTFVVLENTIAPEEPVGSL